MNRHEILRCFFSSNDSDRLRSARMLLHEPRSVVNFSIDDEPRFSRRFVRYELLLRNLAIDSFLRHDDSDLLRLDFAQFENLQILDGDRFGEDGLENVLTGILQSLHPSTGLRTGHCRVLESNRR